MRRDGYAAGRATNPTGGAGAHRPRPTGKREAAPTGGTPTSRSRRPRPVESPSWLRPSPAPRSTSIDPAPAPQDPDEVAISLEDVERKLGLRGAHSVSRAFGAFLGLGLILPLARFVIRRLG